MTIVEDKSYALCEEPVLAELNSLNKECKDDEWYEDWIDALNISDAWKECLRKLVKKTVQIGKTILNIGKILLNAIREIIKNFPAMTIGILLGLFFGLLISTIPFIGGLIAPLVTPLIVIALGIVGFTIDTYNMLTGQTLIRNTMISQMGNDDADKFRSLINKLLGGITF
jgi:hypothetical protein